MIKGNPLTGIHYLTKGFGLLLTPGLRLYVMVPLIINVLLFGGMIYWALSQISVVNEWLVGYLPSWLAWLTWLMIPIFVIGIYFVVMYTFTAIASLVASPFNGLLAEKTEQYLTGQVNNDDGFKELIASIPRSLIRELQKLGYQIPLLLIVMILAFVPVIGLLSSPLWMLLGAWMMAIQYIDIPFDNNALPFNNVKVSSRRHRLTSLGFGGATSLFSMVPLLNLVVIPAAVCGATVFWVEELKQENNC